MITTFRARRRLKMAPDVWREPDELVPEAHTWFRVTNAVHTGYLTEATVSEDELRAALERYCPDLGDQVLSLLKLTPQPRCSPAQLAWALALDPGPLVGPVPRRVRGMRRGR